MDVTAIPVSQQQRVFDCEKEAECALHDLAHMPPAVVLETLLRALIVEVGNQGLARLFQSLRLK